MLTPTLLLVALFWPWIVAGFSALFTLVHCVQELVDDGAPIWRYLRLPVSDLVGLLGLLAFGGAQIVLACAGYIDGHRWALWALLVVRLGDCVVSHWLPWLIGRRPNPGITSTPLYAIEAALLGCLLAT